MGKRHHESRTDAYLDNWGTPDALFEPLHAQFNFTVDACASSSNAKLPRYWTAADSALDHDWTGERLFINPPFGSAFLRPLAKKLTAHRGACEFAVVVPARTETIWWQGMALCGGVIFLPKRVAFISPYGNGAVGGAKFGVTIITSDVIRATHAVQRWLAVRSPCEAFSPRLAHGVVWSGQRRQVETDSGEADQPPAPDDNQLSLFQEE